MSRSTGEPVRLAKPVTTSTTGRPSLIVSTPTTRSCSRASIAPPRVWRAIRNFDSITRPSPCPASPVTQRTDRTKISAPANPVIRLCRGARSRPTSRPRRHSEAVPNGISQSPLPASLTSVSPERGSGGQSPTAAQQTSPFRVKAKFEHVAHARLVLAKGLERNCTPCHGGTGAQFQARPKMPMCESCHDGKKAFDALGTQCFRCHQAPSGRSFCRCRCRQRHFSTPHIDRAK